MLKVRVLMTCREKAWALTKLCSLAAWAGQELQEGVRRFQEGVALPNQFFGQGHFPSAKWDQSDGFSFAFPKEGDKGG